MKYVYMDNRQQTAMRVIYGLAIFVTLFGIGMQFFNKQADGIVGESEIVGEFASLKGW